jgi:hypothetical protein
LSSSLLISIFISIWPDNCQSSLFEIILGHQILNNLLINVWIFVLNSFVTSYISQPYKSTDLTQALKTFIFVSLFIRVDFQIFAVW